MKRAVRIVAVVVLAAFLWVVLVPPLGAQPTAPRPQVAILEGRDNSWHEYHRLGELVESTAALKGLVDPSMPLTRTHEAALDKLPWREIMAAAHLKGSQRFFKPPVVDPLQPPYSYAPERALGKAMMARARQKGSVELALATYKLGTDLAEPNAYLNAVLVGRQLRGWAADYIRERLDKGDLPPIAYRAIHDRIAADLKRFPTPEQAVRWDIEALQRGLEDVLAGRNPGLRPALTRAPGLGGRMRTSVVARLQRQIDLLSPALKSGDLDAIDKAQLTVDKPAFRRGSGVGAWLTSDMVPPVSVNLRQAVTGMQEDRRIAEELLQRTQNAQVPENPSGRPQ